MKWVCIAVVSVALTSRTATKFSGGPVGGGCARCCTGRVGARHMGCVLAVPGDLSTVAIWDGGANEAQSLTRQ
ncbi:MAG: hypothetical protein K8S25_13055 [Alphaproteobacteria bacterium]|nr:hypothetical protein [Alphaproteobacteria bacterium]